MTRFRYAISCVDHAQSEADHITDMVDRGRKIRLATFRRRCETRAWEIRMHYDESLPLERDRHVQFYRSRYRGRPCYFAVHSAIEYIWTPDGRVTEFR